MYSKLIDLIDKLDAECYKEYKDIKAKAYGTRIEHDYAIIIRDEFNKNAGKREIIDEIKIKIKNLLCEEGNNDKN